MGKCGRAKDKEACLKMTASPMSAKKICKYDDGKDEAECDESDNFKVMMDGKAMCCPASRTEWNGDYSKAMKCCKADITRMDGKCSEPSAEEVCKMEKKTGPCRGAMQKYSLTASVASSSCTVAARVTPTTSTLWRRV